jgi:hypothetical protein
MLFYIRRFALILLCTMLSACASMISSATQKMANNLSQAILNQNDMETVKAGAPAYLIMIDGLIEGDPENTAILISGSKLYASYVSAFVEDGKRAKRLAQKSYDYAHTALCIEMETLCNSLDKKPDDFQAVLKNINEKQQPLLYDFATSWATWVQVNSDDWNAIAQIPKLQALFERSIALNETYDYGNAHVYLGVLASQIPPSLGGKPEIARMHFEKAQAISEGKNLMVNVLYAEHYARLVFDQELHDKLLNEVISNQSDYKGLTLVNTLARHRASILLEQSNEYF